jgi:uncharacterized protein YbjT (DUF2867 family)
VIAVVGAAGKTGRAVLNALSSRSASVRPLVRRPSGLEGEVVVDLLDTRSVADGLRNVDAVYHLAPNMHPAEFEIGQRVISAAQQSGVEKIVYHSVLHPQLPSMPHHWDKLRVEESIINSGLRWTIVQPAPYVQNFKLPTDGILRIAYRADAPFSFVDLMDVGEVASIVLTTIKFECGVYELAGPSIITVGEIATALGLQVVSQDPMTWRREALAAGISSEQVSRLTAMFQYYDLHGLVGNPTALTTILGRAPNHALDALRRDRHI